jgi:hypothetical protein
MQDVSTLLNGYVLSAKSCAFFIDMIPRKGFVEVSYKEKIEAELVYDDSKDGGPVGMTSGRYAVESFSWTMLKARWLELLPYLAAKGLGSYGNAIFGFQAVYSEPIHVGPPGVDTIFGCRIVGREETYSEDIKALVVKCEMLALGMSGNGFTLSDPKRAIGL